MKASDLVKRLEPFRKCDSKVHGPAHWARVFRFGDLLAEKMQLPLEQRQCVQVFAWTHDLARWDDNGGNEHAIAGAGYLDEVVPVLFARLSNEQREVIRTAIRHHADSLAVDEAYHSGWFEHLCWGKSELLNTIGCCWDADRLDLLRLGIEPDGARMSTLYWEELLPLARRLNKFSA